MATEKKETPNCQRNEMCSQNVKRKQKKSLFVKIIKCFFFLRFVSSADDCSKKVLFCMKVGIGELILQCCKKRWFTFSLISPLHSRSLLCNGIFSTTASDVNSASKWRRKTVTVWVQFLRIGDVTQQEAIKNGNLIRCRLYKQAERLFRNRF